MKNQPSNRVKFYADTTDGTKNKYFVFPVHNFRHSIDILIKFKREGVSIRAAYFQGYESKSIKIEPTMYEDELMHITYTEQKRYEELNRKV